MPLKLILQLSVRNLFRYPRRNGLLLLAIAFALAGATFTNAMMRGWQYDMLDRAVENLVGHVKVQARNIVTTPICSTVLPCRKATNRKYPGLRLLDGRQESKCQQWC